MFKIGEKLILEQRYANQKETYKCMVVEIGHGSFYIDYPVNGSTGKVAFLVDGTQLQASYTDDEQGTFLFETEVFKKVKGKIPMMELMLPPEEEFIKIQRRQFVRLESSVDVAIHPLEGEFTPFRTVTEDISAGGAALLLKNTMDIHGAPYINVWLALLLNSGEISYLQLKCKVIRMKELNRGAKILSVQFIEPSANDTQIIMRFIFEKQLELRKKGITK